MNYSIINESVFQFYDITEEIKQNGFPPDVYDVEIDERTKSITLKPTKVFSDEIININSPAFKNLVNEVQHFFLPETKQAFKDFGFLYKKSILLHGKPGTGKTCLTIKLMEMFRSNMTNGMVLVNPKLDVIPKLSKVINPEVPVLVILEEFDDVLKYYDEGEVLSMLDGEIQRPNTFYIFTTNYVEKIPNRLFRPSRISNIIEVTNPDENARIDYLRAKLPTSTASSINYWAKQTEGLSLDDLKHTILAVKCMNQNLEQIIQTLKDGHVLLNKPDRNDTARDDYQLKLSRAAREAIEIDRQFRGSDWV